MGHSEFYVGLCNTKVCFSLPPPSQSVLVITLMLCMKIQTECNVPGPGRLMQQVSIYGLPVLAEFLLSTLLVKDSSSFIVIRACH